MNNRTKYTWIAILVAAAVVATSAVAYYSRNNAAKPSSGPGPRPMPVEAARVQIGTMPVEIGTVGTLQANESVVIRSEIAGRVLTIHFAEGQRIAKDKPLISIDPVEYAAQLDQISAEAELNQLNFERAKRLREEGMISQQAYDEIAAKLKGSQANLSLVQARLDKTKIRAPFGGRLGLRQVSPGDYVQPGQAITNLEDVDAIKVDFQIPELYVAQLKTGLAISVQVDAFPGRTFSGKIYAIDPRIDEATRTVLLRARLPNAGGELRPGMFARVTLVLGERRNAILVPEQAVVPMGDAKFVYRVVDGKAALARVTIGQRREGEVEIAEGIGPNDTVITGGQTKIVEGAPVMIINPANAKPGAPAMPAAAKP